MAEKIMNKNKTYGYHQLRLLFTTLQIIIDTD